MDEKEKRYTEGLNNGYLIAKFQPELFAKLEKSLEPKNEYMQGMLSGKNEYEAEKKLALSKDLTQKQQPNKGKTKDFDRER